MLLVIVFVSGAVLMALEMLGSRILAPWFGNSMMVWGSLIGIVLASLSVGYWAGGRLADRRPTSAPLAAALAAAGLWTWVLPEFAGWLLPRLAEALPGPRSGPLVASGLLFAGPSVLLAMVSPWATRLAAHSVETMGVVAGRLAAVSTAGSIIGTLGTAFYLVPLAGVATLVRGLGILLLLLSAAILAHQRLRVLTAVATAATVLLVGVTSIQVTQSRPVPPPPGATEPSNSTDKAVGEIAGPFEDGEILRRDSQYHQIRVRNDGGVRNLHFNHSIQSGMYLNDPLKSVYEYTDTILVPLAMRPDSRRILLVGLGGGTVVKRMLVQLPQAEVHVAELDSAVVDVARTYFGVPINPRLTIAVQDGRQFLRLSKDVYDVIMLDAYLADAVPFHLTTLEFMELLRSRLAPDGLVAANVIGAVEGRRSALLRSVIKTMNQVFPNIYVFPVGDVRPQDYQNVIVVGSPQAKRLEPDAILAAVAKAAPALGVPNLDKGANRLLRSPLPTQDVPLLTDDHAPVDNLLNIYN